MLMKFKITTSIACFLCNIIGNERSEQYIILIKNEISTRWRYCIILDNDQTFKIAIYDIIFKQKKHNVIRIKS